MPVTRRGILKLVPAAAAVPFLSGADPVPRDVITKAANQAECEHLFWTWTGDASDPNTEFTCKDCGRVVHRSQLRGWI